MLNMKKLKTNFYSVAGVSGSLETTASAVSEAETDAAGGAFVFSLAAVAFFGGEVSAFFAGIFSFFWGPKKEILYRITGQKIFF